MIRRRGHCCVLLQSRLLLSEGVFLALRERRVRRLVLPGRTPRTSELLDVFQIRGGRVGIFSCHIVLFLVT